jgi:hypothetical protein
MLSEKVVFGDGEEYKSGASDRSYSAVKETHKYCIHMQFQIVRFVSKHFILDNHDVLF